MSLNLHLSCQFYMITPHLVKIPQRNFYSRTNFNKQQLLFAQQARADTAALHDRYKMEFLATPAAFQHGGEQENSASLDDYFLRKASAWYVVSYKEQAGLSEAHGSPLISFAWVPIDFLLKLKKQS